jgi:hypothetical protein
MAVDCNPPQWRRDVGGCCIESCFAYAYFNAYPYFKVYPFKHTSAHLAPKSYLHIISKLLRVDMTCMERLRAWVALKESSNTS